MINKYIFILGIPLLTSSNILSAEDLKISRFKTTTISNSDVDTILSKATSILQNRKWR